VDLIELVTAQDVDAVNKEGATVSEEFLEAMELYKKTASKERSGTTTYTQSNLKVLETKNNKKINTLQGSHSDGSSAPTSRSKTSTSLRRCSPARWPSSMQIQPSRATTPGE